MYIGRGTNQESALLEAARKTRMVPRRSPITRRLQQQPQQQQLEWTNTTGAPQMEKLHTYTRACVPGMSATSCTRAYESRVASRTSVHANIDTTLYHTSESRDRTRFSNCIFFSFPRARAPSIRKYNVEKFVRRILVPRSDFYAYRVVRRVARVRNTHNALLCLRVCNILRRFEASPQPMPRTDAPAAALSIWPSSSSPRRRPRQRGSVAQPEQHDLSASRAASRRGAGEIHSRAAEQGRGGARRQALLPDHMSGEEVPSARQQFEGGDRADAFQGARIPDGRARPTRHVLRSESSRGLRVLSARAGRVLVSARGAAQPGAQRHRRDLRESVGAVVILVEQVEDQPGVHRQHDEMQR
ncbi:unnamed protein product [Trichogramma brassicae]|uniref:Uncharacterized protein n=1 Tax=Trichogramma brassicae TaxID=86971 RepID=A0A6H5J485_9HYME|nr:unnamed protein product [Trichogramma brassicae]